MIVSTKEHKNIENFLLIDGSPKKILNILEKINVGFLKNKYLDQSELKIGKYKLSLKITSSGLSLAIPSAKRLVKNNKRKIHKDQ